MSMNEIKELLLMTKGGLGGSLINRMFIANTMEGSQMLPNWTNALKDITLIWMPRLANLIPITKALKIQYKR
jgi:hypothetical protein